MNSEAVQSFYERMPYPAPLTNLDQHLTAFRSPERRRIRSLLMFPTGPPNPPDSVQQILVAGCGTSQAAKVALREPTARVVAIDISGTSLTCLSALKERYELKNLELHQLSILDVASVGQTFDQIFCTGVLHHLTDPDQGLRCLREVLDPNGAMQIMVYATYGRTGVYMMQEYCRRLGIEPSKEELDSLSAALKYLPAEHPLGWMLHKFKDFTQPDALADALLHPQDCSYTVPQIYEWLKRCGMSFGRWFEQAPYLPQCGAIANTPHATRLISLPELDQHAAVELFRGSITHHNFVTYRNDRVQAAQPIQFMGEEWRNYIPVRLPWTKIVRQRVPAGSVAVLLNPVHKHSDIFLPINATEDYLFAQIDGARTFAEIERSCKEKDMAQGALPFFQKLWQYDQIVVDAAVSLIVLAITISLFTPVAHAQGPTGYNFRGIAASIEEFDTAFHLKGGFSGQLDVQVVTQSAYIDQNANPFNYFQRVHIRPWLHHGGFKNTLWSFSTSYIKKFEINPTGLKPSQEIRVTTMGTFTQPKKFGSLYEQVRFEVRNIRNNEGAWSHIPRFRVRFGQNFNLGKSEKKPRISMYEEIMFKVQDHQKAYDIGRFYVGYGFDARPRLSISAGLIVQAALRSNGQDLDVYFGPSVAFKYTFGKPKGHPLPPDPDID